MNQPDLFDSGGYQPPTARKTDPETSHQAAPDASQRLEGIGAMRSVIFAYGPCTAQEAAKACVYHWGGSAESFRKRAGDCVALGYAVWGEARKCNVTGRQARTLRPRRKP